MKRLKGLLLGSATSLAMTAPGARAADLPTLQAAPIEYVRICNADGAGFFLVPGTGTCLQVSGLVLGELRGFNPGYSIGDFGITPVHGAFGGVGIPNGFGSILSVSQYTNARSRDATSFDALGRAELNSRTQSPYGTLRAFLGVNANYASGNTSNRTAGSRLARSSTIVNKAFIQFAGLTAGYGPMFDFYADAYSYNNLRGSNATVALLAYTATFGDGFSAILPAKDQASRRSAIGSTIAGTAAAAGGIAPVTIAGVSGSASALATPLAAAAGSTPAYAFLAATTNNYSFALQGGVKLDADYLSPGDKLWLQAAYEKDAFSYIGGNSLAFNYGAVNQNGYAGSAFKPSDDSADWKARPISDCLFINSGSCEQQWGWDKADAYKHYWLPTLASAIYGSYMEVHYPGVALAGFGGDVGISNIKEGQTSTNLVWPPLKGFDIGAEFMYMHMNQSRPAGAASDPVLNAAGWPSFEANTNQYEGRLRVQRAF